MIRALAQLALAATATVAAVTVSAGPVPVAAATPGAPAGAVVTAPAGGGEAAALQVTPFNTCVSCTEVSAGPEGTSSRSTALRLLGHDLAGGTTRNGSSEHDAVLALPSNPVLDVAVASWWTGTQTSGPPAAQSRAALVDLGVLPSGEDSTTGGLVTVALLESFSDATYSGSTSGGYGASNGADIGLANGALVIILLHSQATSDHHGDAYVASVGGAQLLGNGEDSPGLPVAVPGVLGVTLFPVRATGGGGSSAVGTVDPLLDVRGRAAALLSSAAEGHLRATESAAGAVAPPPVGCACGAAAAADPGGAVRVPSAGTSPPLHPAGLLLGLAGAAVGAASLRRRRPR